MASNSLTFIGPSSRAHWPDPKFKLYFSTYLLHSANPLQSTCHHTPCITPQSSPPLDSIHLHKTKNHPQPKTLRETQPKKKKEKHKKSKTSPNMSLALFLTVTSSMLRTGLASFSAGRPRLSSPGSSLVRCMIRASEPRCLLYLVSSNVQFIRRIDVASRPSANMRPLRARYVRPNFARLFSGTRSGEFCVFSCWRGDRGARSGFGGF